MTDIEKRNLYEDLCARLPYGINVSIHYNGRDIVSKLINISYSDNINEVELLAENELLRAERIGGVKPYLRPISSMTNEERKELDSVANGVFEITPNGVEVWSKEFIVNGGTIVNPFARPYKQTCLVSSSSCYQLIGWLNKRHFDYRNLIGRGLALEAPEGMYNEN